MDEISAEVDIHFFGCANMSLSPMRFAANPPLSMLTPMQCRWLFDTALPPGQNCTSTQGEAECGLAHREWVPNTQRIWVCEARSKLLSQELCMELLVTMQVQIGSNRHKVLSNRGSSLI